MLREMRDTAGDSGEFYTPRPVVRFMVEVTDPQLGEVILDPLCAQAHKGSYVAHSLMWRPARFVDDCRNRVMLNAT